MGNMFSNYNQSSHVLNSKINYVTPVIHIDCYRHTFTFCGVCTIPLLDCLISVRSELSELNWTCGFLV